jgi:hypothetical protein
MPRRGCSRRDLAPIRRLLTPKMLPHMAPSGMEFAPGRTVRILPRRSAEAAIGRQRGPPRIDPESSPRDGRSEPHDATAPGRRATPPIDAPGWLVFASEPEPKLQLPATRAEVAQAARAPVPASIAAAARSAESSTAGSGTEATAERACSRLPVRACQARTPSVCPLADLRE